MRDRRLFIFAVAIGLLAITGQVRADIYQWEYVNPVDPSQGRKQSTVLCPDGAGVNAVPNAYMPSRNLTQAYLAGVDLQRVGHVCHIC